MHPGAFKSCLIPHTEQILDWWYDDHLTAAEIQRRLSAQGPTVARTTIVRFIQVRERRAKARIRPDSLKKNPTQNTTSQNPPEKPKPSTTPSATSSKNKPTPTPEMPSTAITPDELEAKAMLNELKNTTNKEFWHQAQEAKEAAKKKK